MLFEYPWVCQAWELAYNVLPSFSIFLVATLAISRSLRIIRPYESVSINAVIVSIVAYTAFLFTVTALNYVFETRYYVLEIGFCIGIAGKSMEHAHFKNFAVMAQIGVPSIVVFVCFIMSLHRVRLLNSYGLGTRNIEYRVSLPVTLFTGLFLVCNAPLFLNTTILLVAQWITGTFPSKIYGSPFMASYSWLLAKILFPALNSVLNPILYIARITDFGQWIRGKKENGSSKREESVKLSGQETGRLIGLNKLAGLSELGTGKLYPGRTQDGEHSEAERAGKAH
eukprot:sb/3479328/